MHAIEYDEGDYDYKSYIFVVSALDGGYVTKMARLQHAKRNYGEHYVTSSGLFYDAYNRVYSTFNMVARYKRNSDNDDIRKYASKLVISAFNTQTEVFDYYHEQELFFGRSSALAYIDHGPDASNLYLGGSTDHCHIYSDSDPKCWTISINRLTSGGLKEKLM